MDRHRHGEIYRGSPKNENIISALKYSHPNKQAKKPKQ